MRYLTTGLEVAALGLLCVGLVLAFGLAAAGAFIGAAACLGASFALSRGPE